MQNKGISGGWGPISLYRKWQQDRIYIDVCCPLLCCSTFNYCPRCGLCPCFKKFLTSMLLSAWLTFLVSPLNVDMQNCRHNSSVVHANATSRAKITLFLLTTLYFIKHNQLLESDRSNRDLTQTGPLCLEDLGYTISSLSICILLCKRLNLQLRISEM